MNFLTKDYFFEKVCNCLSKGGGIFEGMDRGREIFLKLEELFEGVFPGILGNFSAKLGLVLNFVDPKCGGLILVGKRGTGKSCLLNSFKNLLIRAKEPFVEIPSDVGEENLFGSLDIEATLERGIPIYQPGLLDKAKGAYLLIDDLHLMKQELLSIIFNYSSNYTLIAAMSEEEGALSPHYLDKFGLLAVTEEFKDVDSKRWFLKGFINFEGHEGVSEEKISFLRLSRSLREKVRFSEREWEFLVERASRFGVSSHRAEIFYYYAARALTVLTFSERPNPEHFLLVEPLVFGHRGRLPEEKISEQREEEKGKEESKEHKEAQREHPSEELERRHDDRASQPKEARPSVEGEGSFQHSIGGEPEEALSSEFIKPKGREEVFPIKKYFEIRDILFARDRASRAFSGRRVSSKWAKKQGSIIRRSPDLKNRDLDLFGTILRAAPYQKIRGREDKLVLKPEDLVYRERERRAGLLVVFLVDASGSLGAKRRMELVKGALFSLLTNSYKNRDKVALIVFRKFGAELLLGPTKSADLAHKVLKEIITGGHTPLSAGLFEAYKLIKKYRLKHPTERVLLVVVTDGRANIPLQKGNDPLEEVQRIALKIREIPHVYSLVIDSEDKNDYLKFDLSRELANWLAASYYELDQLKSEGLIRMIKAKSHSLS